jgi:choline dehydrogenase
VLAHRLSADGRSSVFVLEYGGSDRSPVIEMPAALSIPMRLNAYNWGYRTEPEPQLGNRRLRCPRRKGARRLPSINGLVHVRGHPLDFERWAEAPPGLASAEVEAPDRDKRDADVLYVLEIAEA